MINEKIRRVMPPGAALGIGVLAVSTASTFIRLAQGSIPSLAVAAWRLTIASAVLAPFGMSKSRTEWETLAAKEKRWVMFSGVLLAIHFYAWITSLALTSVAASVVLVTTSPLFVGLISYFFLHERLDRSTVLGIVISLVGSLIIGWGDFGQGSHRVLGDILAILAALAVAGYMLIGQHLRKKLSLMGYIFPVYTTAAVLLMGGALLSGVPMRGYSSDTWLWLLLVALIPQIVGHSSLNWALGHLPTIYVSLATLAEPVGSTLLAWLVLGEVPTLVSVLGGILILTGIVLANMRRRKKPVGSAS